ncbi:MAG TPA: hypothetical protein VMU04_12215 [Candidatus Acidoferrum sp.]|nr:hypothetical protein [Candidatus Acidoferrum sp.]
MPDTPKKKLQKFLVNLVEKPHTLRRLKADPEGFIAKSGLSPAHKKILLGGNAGKIKDLVAGAGGKALIAMVWLLGVARKRVTVLPNRPASAGASVKRKAAKKSPASRTTAAIVFATKADV